MRGGPTRQAVVSWARTVPGKAARRGRSHNAWRVMSLLEPPSVASHPLIPMSSGNRRSAYRVDSVAEEARAPTSIGNRMGEIVEILNSGPCWRWRDE